MGWNRMGRYFVASIPENEDFCPFSSAVLIWGQFCLQETRATSTDISDCQKGGQVLLAPSKQRPRMLLNIHSKELCGPNYQ